MDELGAWRFRGDRELKGRTPAPRARTLGALLSEQASIDPGADAIVSVSDTLSYAALDTLVDRVAQGLLALGVSKGGHVALLMGNRPEWVVSWLAINRIGAVCVGVSTWSSMAELLHILRHSDACLLIHAQSVGPRDLSGIVRDCLRGAADTRGMLLPWLPSLRAVIELPAAPSAEAALTPITGLADRIPKEIVAGLSEDVRPADVALLLYTSGSTATPKGVQLVHRNLIENAFDIGEGEYLGRRDRFWLSLPLFWSAGSANTAMAVLTHGATMVLQEYFEPATAARLLRDERCTHYFAFPNVTRAIRDALGEEPKLPAAKVAVSSGQPEVLQMLQEMGFTRLLHPYGTTEDYGFATINDDDDDAQSLGWSQGHPLPGMELKIVDPATGQAVARGVAGEISLRGNVTIGYYKDEDKNRAVFDDEGYFHTGDLAIQHTDGRLQFLGRLTEMIKTSGFNVSPAEVEAVIAAFPGVMEAHVVGVADADLGQRVVACVRLSRADLEPEVIRKHCGSQLSSYKTPRAVLVFDAFPMTTTGKVSKQALKELAAARISGGAP